MAAATESAPVIDLAALNLLKYLLSCVERGTLGLRDLVVDENDHAPAVTFSGTFVPPVTRATPR